MVFQREESCAGGPTVKLCADPILLLASPLGTLAAHRNVLQREESCPAARRKNQIRYKFSYEPPSGFISKIYAGLILPLTSPPGAPASQRMIFGTRGVLRRGFIGKTLRGSYSSSGFTSRCPGRAALFLSQRDKYCSGPPSVNLSVYASFSSFTASWFSRTEIFLIGKPERREVFKSGRGALVLRSLASP